MRIAQRAPLAVAWLTMFVVGTELFVFSPLLPLLAAAYHISLGMAGLAVTTFSWAYMLGAPLFGHIADRAGRRRVLIVSLFAFAAANALTAFAADLPSLLAVRFLAGAAAAGVSPSVYALVGAAAPPERRAGWLAVTVSGLLVSLACGASGAALVGATLGWPTIFLALAGLSLLLTGLNRLVWRSEPRIAVIVPLVAAHDRLAAPVLVRRLIPMLVWSTGLYGVYTYLGAGLHAAGFSTADTARAIMFYGCGAIAGALIGGRAADRFGVKFTTGASLAGLSVCLLLLRLALDARAFVVPAIGVSSAVAQLFFPAQQAGLARDFPGQCGAALAWNNSALFFGISLGSLVGAQAVALCNFDADLMVCAGVALFGWLMNALVVPGRLERTAF
jgi:MFS transporter, DHA1 family, putative efflux transporter